MVIPLTPVRFFEYVEKIFTNWDVPLKSGQVFLRDAQVAYLDIPPALQISYRPLIRYAPFLDDISPVAEREGKVGVLLAEEDHESFGFEPANLFPEVLHDQWRKPLGGLVEE